MNILLVRHGESEANVDKTILLARPDHNIGLSEQGKRDAQRCGEFLKSWCPRERPMASWRMWHSPYKRAVQTAKLVEVNSLPVVRDRKEHILLGEQQFGLFDGIPDNELAARFPLEDAHYKKHEAFEGRFWARFPLGESRFDVAQRVHQAFGTFHRDADRHGIHDIIIVAHGVTLRAFVMMWCHKDVAWFEAEPNPLNCSVRWIDGDGEDRGYIYSGRR